MTGPTASREPPLPSAPPTAPKAVPAAARVLGSLGWAALAISALPLGLALLGLLATIGQQCTPTSRTHGVGQTALDALMVAGIYAVPALPALLLILRSQRSVGAAAGGFVLAISALLLAVLELFGTALGTMC